jgi:hypothetical protein
LGDAQDGARSLSLWYDNRVVSAPTAKGVKDELLTSDEKPAQRQRGQGRGRGKMQTLFSSGILRQSRKKNNEYFGGDSTVVSAGEEEEKEEGEADGGGNSEDSYR